MSEKTQEHVTEKEYDEGGAKSHVMIVEDRDDLRSLDTNTRSTPESRRQANLRAYLSLWNMRLRMELDASTLGERRDEEEDSDDHGAADTQRLVDAGVCIPRARSEVLGSKEYKLEWTKTEGRRIKIHQQVALTPFAENPPGEPYYLKVTAKKKQALLLYRCEGI